jgi:multidrug efflux pump
MWLSDTSVRRPVLAMVMNLILIAFGVVAYIRLQVREYPDIEPPIVTVETYYRGASAGVVERRITQRLEDRISQVEAISNISSVSADGKSEITVEFNLGRDLDARPMTFARRSAPFWPRCRRRWIRRTWAKRNSAPRC